MLKMCTRILQSRYLCLLVTVHCQIVLLT